jgi:hypothetical protein
MDPEEVADFIGALPARTGTLATVRADTDELRHWATVIGGRYVGADRAEADGARNGVPGELVVRIRPTGVVAVAGLSD